MSLARVIYILLLSLIVIGLFYRIPQKSRIKRVYNFKEIRLRNAIILQWKLKPMKQSIKYHKGSFIMTSFANMLIFPNALKTSTLHRPKLANTTRNSLMFCVWAKENLSPLLFSFTFTNNSSSLFNSIIQR